ncbi:MAG: phosphate/phosphite/phosphonate ABC transporter substrate-binding protein [Acholeplasmatales bacterium]|jgi:phosphonate transport system substrate-binding protein|nr:phosphate/phosphite/phosphonate ABC transporter substrate-binding protein [Acholeplasmatales bacterium]
MKKVFLLICCIFVLFFGVACSGGGDDPDTINIWFVPSRSAQIISDNKVFIEEALAAKLNKKVVVDTGTSYNAVLEGMLSDQIDVGFLTAQQYAAASIDEAGKVEAILTSVRDAYQVQIDHPNDFPAQIAAMNLPSYHGEQAVEKASSYSSICIVKTENYGAGKIATIADLAGKTVAVQASTSGAGYVYPSVALHNAGLKFTTNEVPGPNEVKAITIAPYASAVTALLQGQVDAAWIFLDVRYANFYVTGDDLEIFNKTKVVAMTPGIYNDTVSVRSNLKASLKQKIADAFIEIAESGSKEVKDALYNIYSHTGYLKANDKDYDGERQVCLFKREQEA